MNPQPPAYASLVLPGRFRAAVFDMDGLLLDTEPMWNDAERELLERHGETFTEADLIASAPLSLGETAALYSERLGRSARDIEQELSELMLARYVSGAPLCPCAQALVEALDGRMLMAVASNTTRAHVRQALDAVGLVTLTLIASATDLGSPKPAPDAYLEACRLLEVGPIDTVAFEDSPVGIQAAKAAGLFAVGISRFDGVELQTAGADLVFGSLCQVVTEPA